MVENDRETKLKLGGGDVMIGEVTVARDTRGNQFCPVGIGSGLRWFGRLSRSRGQRSEGGFSSGAEGGSDAFSIVGNY